MPKSMFEGALFSFTLGKRKLFLLHGNFKNDLVFPLRSTQSSRNKTSMTRSLSWNIFIKRQYSELYKLRILLESQSVTEAVTQMLVPFWLCWENMVVCSSSLRKSYGYLFLPLPTVSEISEVLMRILQNTFFPSSKFRFYRDFLQPHLLWA